MRLMTSIPESFLEMQNLLCLAMPIRAHTHPALALKSAKLLDRLVPPGTASTRCPRSRHSLRFTCCVDGSLRTRTYC
jgi:hypothetical protein